MRKEMLIRMESSSEKGKAIKVAAGVQGVESVTLAGEDRNLLLVIGVGVDSNRITKKLRQKVGHAEVVELRTVDADELGAGAGLAVVPAEHAYRYNNYPMSPSPYNGNKHHYYAGGRMGGYPRERDYHYQPNPYSNKHHHAGGGGPAAYALPPTMAAGGRDRDYYYGSGGGGGYYQVPYHHQQQHYYQQPTAGNMHTVVHHEYPNDPNGDGCSIM